MRPETSGPGRPHDLFAGKTDCSDGRTARGRDLRFANDDKITIVVVNRRLLPSLYSDQNLGITDVPAENELYSIAHTCDYTTASQFFLWKTGRSKTSAVERRISLLKCVFFFFYTSTIVSLYYIITGERMPRNARVYSVSDFVYCLHVFCVTPLVNRQIVETRVTTKFLKTILWYVPKYNNNHL